MQRGDALWPKASGLYGRAAQGEIFGDQPPSFPPAGHRARRIGVVDVGSNSVRLVVFEGHCRSPSILFNEKVMCGLGASLQRTNRLDLDGRKRALAALTRFAAIADGFRVGALAGVATAAIRDAEDGRAFRNLVEQETGIRLRIASGEDEARLAAAGVAFGNPAASGVVVDLGGGSLEFCKLDRGRPGTGITTPLGPLLMEAMEDGAEVDAEIRRHLDALPEEFQLAGGRMFLVGGAWRALGRLNMVRQGYPLRVLHEYNLNAAAAMELGEWVATETPKNLIENHGVSQSRARNFPYTGRLLTHLIRVLMPGDAQISAFGLREGVCLENLTPPVRAQDPLIAACLDQEERRARAPGFGADLARWVIATLSLEEPADRRLAMAAAMLADLNWRTHPDYRAQGCWETVTRTTLTDIGHEGRVFLGAALVARHRNVRKGGFEDQRETELLSDARKEEAIRLGLALRLGTVLAGCAKGVLTYCRVWREAETLVLALEGPALRLAGEEVNKRHGNLARAMGLEPELRLAEDG